MMQVKYGVPLPQTAYGPPLPQALYGVPTPVSPIYGLISIITSPFTIIVSFVLGTILYLATNKKIFLIIPLILFAIFIILTILGF